MLLTDGPTAAGRRYYHRSAPNRTSAAPRERCRSPIVVEGAQWVRTSHSKCPSESYFASGKPRPWNCSYPLPSFFPIFLLTRRPVQSRYRSQMLPQYPQRYRIPAGCKEATRMSLSVIPANASVGNTRSCLSAVPCWHEVHTVGVVLRLGMANRSSLFRNLRF
jgi:hypothetical protein